jgi:hypothetical protein
MTARKAFVARMEEGAKQADAIGRCKSDSGKAEQAAWKRVLREPTATPATKRTQRFAWGV